MPAIDLKRLEELFQAVADLPDDAREAFLDREADPALRPQLEAMLEQMDRDETLEAPPGLIAETPAATEGPGTVIDRYKLLQVIGEGGFGVVYMAEQLEPVVRKVALKVIKLGMDTREVVARFEAERQALALMDHPSIAKVLDGGATEAGRPYFVMELVRGVAITDYCDQNGSSTRERLELFAEVCHAVHHAHQKGVIHRDLKPTNVMVTLHDGRPVPKVIDFGIAKAMHTRLTEKTLFTAYQRFIGTPAYMSPEQAEMSGLDVDTRSDIYSLGVLLYELLTGTTPFDSKSLFEAGLLEIQRVLREELPQRPSLRVSTSENAAMVASRRRLDADGLARRLRGDLDWIVMKALDKDRTRRYAAASDLAADVQRHLRDEPVLASPPSAAYRLRKALARNRSLVVSAAIVALALVAGIVGTSLGMLEASRQRDAARREAERARVSIDFLVDNLELSDPEVALQPDVTVRGLLERAAGQVAERFAAHPRAEARMRATIGRAYESLGEHELGETHLRRAIELVDQLGVEDTGEYYDTLWTLVNVCFRLQRDDSFVMVQRARRARHDHIRATQPELAEMLDRFVVELDRGAHSAEQGAIEPARALFAETARLAGDVLEPGDPLWPMLAHSFLSAGYWVWYTPHEWASEEFFSQALAIQERELAPGHPETGETLGQLVGVLNRLGRAAEAEARIRESLEAMRRVYPPGTFHLALHESMLGANVAAQGRYAEAEPLLLSSHDVIVSQAARAGDFFALDSFVRLVQLYDGWGRPESASPYRVAFAERLVSTKEGAGWTLARHAFGPEAAAIEDGLDRLQAITGDVRFLATPGDVDSPELAPLLDELVLLRRRLLDDDAPESIVYARLLLGFAHSLDPARAVGARRRMAGEALTILRAADGEHLMLEAAGALAILSEVAAFENDPDQALRHAREAWRLAHGWHEGDNWFTAGAKVRIGRCLLRLRQFSEAESLLLEAENVLNPALGESHDNTKEARAQLAALYTAWGKPEQASEYAPLT